MQKKVVQDFSRPKLEMWDDLVAHLRLGFGAEANMKPARGFLQTTVFCRFKTVKT